MLTAAEWMMPAGGDGEHGDVKLFIPDNLLVGRGGLIAVPVKLEITGNEGITISGFEVVLEFDFTKFTVVGSELGQLLAEPNSDVEPTWTNPADGILIQLGDSTLGSVPFDVGTVGDLFTVTFAVASDAPSGPSPINIRAAYSQTTTAIVSNDLSELVIWPTPTDAPDDPNDGTVTIVENPRIDMTVVHEPTATIGNGEVATLPDSADWVHEWQAFWVEIWVSTPDTTTVGVADAMVDLRYTTDYLTAIEIVHNPAFNLDPSGTINDTQGLVSGLGGRTELTNVGDHAYVLLARVRFASTGDDQVPVDAAGRNIGPYDMGLVLASGQTELVDVGAVVPELGGSPETDLWAVMYDIEDNHQIDFGDLSFFAAAFGETVEEPASEPPHTWWADFNKSGRVDFGDLAFFAPNFGKTRQNVQSGDQTLVFPLNFPGAWRNGAGDDQADGGGEGEWLSLSGDGALEPVVDGSESPPDLRAFSAILPRQQKHEPSQAVDRVADHLVAVMTDASMEVFAQPAKLPIADRIHPVTDDAFAQLGTEGTERWTSVRPESVGRQWDDFERSRHSIHGGGRWESLEDTLSVLAERPTRELRDDMLDPLEALFARIGR